LGIARDKTQLQERSYKGHELTWFRQGERQGVDSGREKWDYD